MANTRLKDYFDLWVLSQHAEFEGSLLCQALAATFERRKTAIETEPIGLSDEFANDDRKASQWTAFIKKNKLNAPALPEAVQQLNAFLAPLLLNIASGQNFTAYWPHGGPWQEKIRHDS
jgi:hypothetical protein